MIDLHIGSNGYVRKTSNDKQCKLYLDIYGEPLTVNMYCTGKCKKCGWNPKVAEKRREQIRQFAAEGRLHEWGK